MTKIKSPFLFAIYVLFSIIIPSCQSQSNQQESIDTVKFSINETELNSGNFKGFGQYLDKFYDSTSARLSSEVPATRLKENGTISVLFSYSHEMRRDTVDTTNLISEKKNILSIPFKDRKKTKRNLDWRLAYHLEKGDTFFVKFVIDKKVFDYNFVKDTIEAAAGTDTTITFETEIKPERRFTDIIIITKLKRSDSRHEILGFIDSIDSAIKED